MYRAQRHDAGSSSTFYTPALTSASALSGTWAPGVKAFDTDQDGTGLAGFNSFLAAGSGQPSVFYSSGTAFAAPITEMWNGSLSSGMSFLGPGNPVELAAPSAPEALLPNGNYLIRDPATARQYVVIVANRVSGMSADQLEISGSKIFLLESVLGSGVP